MTPPPPSWHLACGRPWEGENRCQINGLPLDRPTSAILARKAGMTVVPRVTKKVQVLVNCDPGYPSGNAVKAQEYGISIVTEQEFGERLGLTVSTRDWRRG